MVDNLFTPLVEATLHPAAHPELAALLAQVVAFDSGTEYSPHRDTGTACSRQLARNASRAEPGRSPK